MRANNTGYAFNLTRQTFLATQMRVADTHYQRLVGLIGTKKSEFHSGAGLWIAPCHGIHTFAMRFPIDVLYLDRDQRVLRIEHGVRPWRLTPVLVEAATVVELPEHTAWSTGTQVGDQMEIRIGQEATQEATQDAGCLRAS